MKKYLCALTAIFFCSGCEKELHLDYRSVDPLYVIQGSLTNQGTEVWITRTRDMEDGRKSQGIGEAAVVVTGEDGTWERLVFQEDGCYRSALVGTPGVAYTLRVSIGEEEFLSTSTMQNQAEILPLEFEWVRVMSGEVLMCSMFVQDIPGEENYYYLWLLKNDENYR
ncbi:MAG: DUF4249 domain-containing protein [Rikenellaceae bacterium]|nr:DUF4249 domain-containing protein [Rikenellaceae bacterium]